MERLSNLSYKSDESEETKFIFLFVIKPKGYEWQSLASYAPNTPPVLLGHTAELYFPASFAVSLTQRQKFFRMECG